MKIKNLYILDNKNLIYHDFILKNLCWKPMERVANVSVIILYSYFVYKNVQYNKYFMRTKLFCVVSSRYYIVIKYYCDLIFLTICVLFSM